MSLDDTCVARLPCAVAASRGTRRSDHDTAVYIEDGWIFRMKPGTPIECVRDTRGARSPSAEHLDAKGRLLFVNKKKQKNFVDVLAVTPGRFPLSGCRAVNSFRVTSDRSTGRSTRAVVPARRRRAP